jgi:twitching motility two-component system response regulator PilG
MVIDDSNTIRRSAEIFLAQAGCEVILADDGFDALVKITDHQPDLIFVDIVMPRLDGYQTCALIKRNNRFAATPVVMLSSKDGLFDRARGRMVGSDEYLTKPFTKDSLLRSVDRHAGGKRTKSASDTTIGAGTTAAEPMPVVPAPALALDFSGFGARADTEPHNVHNAYSTQSTHSAHNPHNDHNPHAPHAPHDPHNADSQNSGG